MPKYEIRTIIAVGIGIIIIINLIAIIFGFVNMASLSSKIQTKLDATNDLLTQLNQNIEGLDQLNEQISQIRESIDSIDGSIASLLNNTKSVSAIQTSLVEVKQELNSLTKVYPPNQTIVLNNVNEDNLNTIINNAVDLEFKKVEWKTNFNFWLNIVFGTISLFSLGGIAIYLIFSKKERQ